MKNVRTIMLNVVLLLSLAASACTSVENNIRMKDEQVTLFGKPVASQVVTKTDANGRPTADGLQMGRHAILQVQGETRQKGPLNIVRSTTQDHLFEAVASFEDYVDPNTGETYTHLLRQTEFGSGVGGTSTPGVEIGAGVVGELAGKAVEGGAIVAGAKILSGRKSDSGGSFAYAGAGAEQNTEIDVDVNAKKKH